MAEQLRGLVVGQLVEFVYNGEVRQVEFEAVNECGNGNKVLVGKDVNKNHGYRSFSINKMSNIVMK